MLLAILLSCACDGTADDLLRNGGFEAQPDDASPIPGWTIEMGATNGAETPRSSVTLDPDATHGGSASLRFSGETSTRGWLIAKQRFDVRPNGRYVLRGWTRAQGVVREGPQFNNCYMGLLFEDGLGSNVGKRFEFAELPDSDWAEHSIELAAPDAARSGWVYLFLSMTGDFWVDDVRLEVSGGDDPPPVERVLFEDFSKGTRLPSKWKKEVGAQNGTGGKDSQVVVDTEVGWGDAPRSLRLAGDLDTMRWHSIERRFKAEPGDLFRLKAKVKAEDVRREGVQFGNLHVRLVFLDKKGEGLGSAMYGHPGVGSYDWKDVAVKGIAPEGTKQVLAGIFLSMSGTAWFDQLEITRTDGGAPPYSDWVAIENKDVILRYPKDHPNAKQMKQYAKRLRSVKADICRALEVEFDEKITVYLYKDLDQGRALTGGSLDFADPAGRRVHQQWNSYIGHEMVHVIAHTKLNDGRTGILGEGIAVWLNGQAPEAHHQRAMGLLAKGELPSVANLLSQFRSESQGYPASGSFCGYLIDTYGLETFKKIYPLTDPSSTAKELVGVSFVEMEKGWHEELRKYR